MRMINIIANDICALPISEIESIISSETFIWLDINKLKLKVINLIRDDRRIKTFIILKNGNVYPSTFSLSALVNRIQKAEE